MLIKVRAALTAAAAIVALAAGGLLAASPAVADVDANGCDPVSSVCYTLLSYQPSDPAPSPDSNGWSSGASTCYLLTSQNQATLQGYPPDQIYIWSDGQGYTQWYVIVDCGTGTAYWSNNRQCYVSMVDGPWPAIPPGYDADAGYYVCKNALVNGGLGVDDIIDYFWSNTVPPGLQVLTPGAAAAQLIATFQLRPITIGMAPDVNPEVGHRRAFVGVPVWLWVADPEPLTWGPYSETATLGGQTITATATVSSSRWNMGDGSADVVCGSIGTPYSTGYGFTDSPTCGHRYEATSDHNPSAGDRFTVTATTTWVVTWTSVAGAAGTVNLQLTTAGIPLEVNELQTVIVPNN